MALTLWLLVGEPVLLSRSDFMRTPDDTKRVAGDTALGDDVARPRVPRAVLDVDYPHLSAAVRDVLSLTLDQLADRSPCRDIFKYFDLERLLAAVRDNPLFNDPEFTTYSDNWAQVRGYLSTFDAYIGLGVLKNPADFITNKLLAPMQPLLVAR
jgi:hypothetical protein